MDPSTGLTGLEEDDGRHALINTSPPNSPSSVARGGRLPARFETDERASYASHAFHGAIGGLVDLDGGMRRRARVEMQLGRHEQTAEAPEDGERGTTSLPVGIESHDVGPGDGDEAAWLLGAVSAAAAGRHADPADAPAAGGLASLSEQSWNDALAGAGPPGPLGAGFVDSAASLGLTSPGDLTAASAVPPAARRGTQGSGIDAEAAVAIARAMEAMAAGSDSGALGAPAAAPLGMMMPGPSPATTYLASLVSSDIWPQPQVSAAEAAAANVYREGMAEQELSAQDHAALLASMHGVGMGGSPRGSSGRGEGGDRGNGEHGDGSLEAPACGYCGKAFTFRSNLLRHVRNVHERRRDHWCKRCSPAKGFATADALKTHARAVHDQRRDFVCEHCGKGFTRKAHLQHHLNAVHGPSSRARRRRQAGEPFPPDEDDGLLSALPSLPSLS